ncbi:response regulator [Maridesulfovibrio frigidus]|uniref:response regulator n=1 Tax=Maridesulfovibrio frigidus TaxID=340956 RepID=UPI0004E0BC5A|nr:response regulator [Maridesulfovibrio frigidus]
MNILLADDEKINLLSASRLLEKSGYTVTTAINGLEVLDILKKDDFDCILMDLEMPKMDGFEATHQIRTDPSFGDKSKIPIIAMTGHSIQDKKYELDKAGIKEYVSKPFDIAILIQTIKKATSS